MLKSLFFFAVLGLTHCTCPSGFDLVRDGECRGLKTTLTYTGFASAMSQAVPQCNAIQANPVIIHNDEKQSYWTTKVRGGYYFVLALVCNTTNKRWEWTDGSKLDYRPAIYHTDLDTDCKTACTWYLATNGKWDTSCSTSGSYSFDYSCTKQIPPMPVPNPDGCESFESDGDDGVCYQISTMAASWRDAQMICRNVGANLASIHSSQENSFIRRLGVSNGKVNGLYIGALNSTDGFGWIDGSSWDYNNFYPGFPINGLGNCLILDTQGSSGEWSNVACDSKFAVACERPQNFTSPLCPSQPPKEGEFVFSPGFPFDASLPCDYILMVDEGKKVEVEIIMLEANSCCDHLLIYENYAGSTLLANMSGEQSQKIYTTKSSNFMKVSWQPNGGVNVRGFMMTFRGV